MSTEDDVRPVVAPDDATTTGGGRGTPGGDTPHGWSLPRTRSGRAALVAAPPWHYSGELITVDFTVAPDAAAEFLPAALEPDPGGAAWFVAADWCSTSDADPRVGADPARGQHREVYIALAARHRGRRVARIAAIWVDNDLSLVRGLIQGFPKKLGTIAMTRPVELGRGGARKQPGHRFTAHVSALGHRLAQASVAIDAEEPETRPRGVTTPLIHTRYWPTPTGGGPLPAVDELSRGTVSGFELGRVFGGAGTLTLHASPYEELDLLAPVSVGRGAVFAMAFTVTGATAVEP